MAKRDRWKTLSPTEQLLDLVRRLADLEEKQKLYTRLQGIRLESRKVGGQRQLWAVVDDATATNNGASVQLLP